MTGVAEPPSEIARELLVLESELKRLEAEYNMFFGGRLPRPPWETRTRVETMVKRLDRASISNYGDRFRFGSLQSRFSTFVELWDRGLRAREEGRSGPFAPPRPVDPAAGRSEDDRILHVTTMTDPLREMDKLHDLYDRLVEAKRDSGTAGDSVSSVCGAGQDAGLVAEGEGDGRGGASCLGPERQAGADGTSAQAGRGPEEERGRRMKATRGRVVSEVGPGAAKTAPGRS